MWALFVITLLDKGDAKYTRIETVETRFHCENILEKFYDKHEPFQDNEIVTCLRVDE